MPSHIKHVAVVGAGFSGTLLAINLLRRQLPHVTLIERRERMARGGAYSTRNPAHLLNVRSANMSAFPDELDHFRRWYEARTGETGQSFASRDDYGTYLSQLLEDAQARWPERLRVVQDEVVELTSHPDRVDLDLARGGRLRVDAAVLALGNLPPHDPPGINGAALSGSLYLGDPWQVPVAAGLGTEDAVCVLGTGLTMVDAVLSLDTVGHSGRIVALSRHGLLPRAHGSEAAVAPMCDRPASSGSALLADRRARAAEIGWRAAVDELRPHTQALWSGASIADQRRFVRHLRPWWDVHRHRLAPAVAKRIRELHDAGRLAILAGRITACREEDNMLVISWRARGDDATRTLPVHRLINCTGPQGDLLRTREPLLRLLLAGGQIRPDPHRLGLDVNQRSEVHKVTGEPDPRLLAVGPLTRGAFWETVAVPDIRLQVWNVAEQLAGCCQTNVAGRRAGC